MAEERAQGDLFMLMDDQHLRTLAVLLRNQEQPLSFSINSEPDRAKFLKECNDAYDVVITLLENSIDLRNKHEAARANHSNKADIATDIQEYVKYGINLGMQCVQNCGMRVSVVEKMKEHFDDLAAELNMSESRDMNDIKSLVEEVSYYKNSMREYATNLRSPSSRARSKAYSDVLKLQGIEFPTLVNMHKNRLGYEDEFEFLEEEQKLEVYNSIIEESGRAKMPVVYRRTNSGIKKPGGIAAMEVTAGIMAWDIYTAEHDLEAALNSFVSLVSGKAYNAVKVSVAWIVETVVADIELATILASVPALVVALLVNKLLSAGTREILEAILGNGGKVPPNLDDLRCYSVTMPNGMALAYEISHT